MLRGSKASLKIIGVIPLGTDEGLSPTPVECRDRGPRTGNPQALLSARCGGKGGEECGWGLWEAGPHVLVEK